MDEIRNKLMETNLSINSIDKVYMVKYKKLSQGLNKKGVKFLLDYDEVMKWLTDNYDKLETRKSYLSAIINILRVYDMDTDKYVEKQKEINEVLNSKRNQHKKNEKQEKNFVPIKELKSVIPYYEKLINKTTNEKEHYNLLKKWIVAYIYVGDSNNPPFRLDYSVELIDKSEYDPESKNNYLVLKKNIPEIFHFGNHKTSAKTGIKKVRVGQKLKGALQIWLKNNKSDKYLLLNDRGGKMSANSLGIFISKVFEPLGKHITLNDLRHIFISELLDIDYEMSKKRKILAKKMGHSLETQESYHLK